MCDCIKTTAEKLKAHIIEQKGIAPDAVTSAKFDNTSLILSGNSLISGIVLPFTIIYKAKTRSGQEKERKIPASMSMNYCPFCGEKIEKPSAR